MAIQFVHRSWHKIAYRRVNGTVTTYLSQKKKGHLQLINLRKRTHQCQRGYQTEHITNYNFIKLKNNITNQKQKLLEFV